MKKIFLTIIILFIFCNCATLNSDTSKLNKTEINLLNAFIQQELNRIVYSRNPYDSILIIKDATPKKQIIEDYESYGIKKSLFDSLTIIKIKKN
jgi:hypothetical protein